MKFKNIEILFKLYTTKIKSNRKKRSKTFLNNSNNINYNKNNNNKNHTKTKNNNI